jgi:hypothetical protein
MQRVGPLSGACPTDQPATRSSRSRRLLPVEPLPVPGAGALDRRNRTEITDAPEL